MSGFWTDHHYFHLENDSRKAKDRVLFEIQMMISKNLKASKAGVNADNDEESYVKTHAEFFPYRL